MSPRSGASGAGTPERQFNRTASQQSSRSARAVQTTRCAEARGAYLICVRILALTRSGELVLPHPHTKKIDRRLRGLTPSLQPAAAAAVRMVVEARTAEAFSRWIRRHRDLVRELLEP